MNEVLCNHTWTTPYDVKTTYMNASFARFLPELFSGGAINAGCYKFHVECLRKCINCNKIVSCFAIVRDSSINQSPSESKLVNAKWHIVKVVN